MLRTSIVMKQLKGTYGSPHMAASIFANYKLSLCSRLTYINELPSRVSPIMMCMFSEKWLCSIPQGLLSSVWVTQRVICSNHKQTRKLSDLPVKSSAGFIPADTPQLMQYSCSRRYKASLKWVHIWSTVYTYTGWHTGVGRFSKKKSTR